MAAMTWLILFFRLYAPIAHSTKMQGSRIYLGMDSSLTKMRRPKNSMNSMITEAISMAAKMP